MICRTVRSFSLNPCLQPQGTRNDDRSPRGEPHNVTVHLIRTAICRRAWCGALMASLKVGTFGVRASGLHSYANAFRSLPICAGIARRKAISAPFHKECKFLVADRPYSDERVERFSGLPNNLGVWSDAWVIFLSEDYSDLRSFERHDRCYRRGGRQRERTDRHRTRLGHLEGESAGIQCNRGGPCHGLAPKRDLIRCRRWG